ncbi:MAG: amino acid permease [Pirellulaceae bacterium]|nr:amino acid permease [Planctomycetales bacterium]
MLKQLLRKRRLKDLLAEGARENRLHRILDTKHLTYIGIGAIIGTGIFVLVGKVARDTTGPAITLSFVFAGLLCVLAAFCYAEFASMAPVEGSAYTYGYCTLGEIFAWIIAWDLVLEYAVAASAVAHGWSHYFQDMLGLINQKIPWITLTVPEAFARAPFDYDHHGRNFVATGSYFDLPAVFITAVLTVLLVKGIKESAGFNAVMVVLKVAVVLAVIVVGLFYLNPANWKPFAPFGFTGVSFFGHTILGGNGTDGKPVGALAGAAIMFFAFIGFDGVSAHSAEAKNPERDVPRAIILSLIICTVLYIAVGGVLTGMVPYTELDPDAPVSRAFGKVGLEGFQFLIAVAAVAGMTSVMLVSMLTQPRILLALARDGLLPHWPFGVIHSRFRTPWISTILTGVFVATLAGLLPLSILADLVSIGTLLAFGIVCGAVLVMRYLDPEAERPFRTPAFPWVPIGGILGCLLLMFSLPWENWLRLFVWLAVGFAIYFTYGFWRSKQRAIDEAVAREATT